MRILIIEDEQNNADRLMRLVHDIKPDDEELAQALDKVVTENISTTEAIAKILESVGKIYYRERFLIAFRDTYNVVLVSEMSHVCIQDGIVSLYTTKKKSYILNITLDELEKQLDPQRFMRVNRQFIVSAAAVEKLSAFFIGTVVDDSIVVVEAVKARFDEGYTSARKASEDAMSGLSVTLFTTTLVFMVIFIPVAFMGGTTGIFFKQFGLTMAVAVGISLINALTLSPALCALMLRPDTTDDKGVMHYLRKAYNITFSSLSKHYSNLVSRLLNRKVWVTCSVAVSLLLFGILFKIVPTGFIPNEDMGTLFVDITAPSGYTAHKTVNLMNRVCDNIRELPEVQDVGGVVGVGSGSNGGFELRGRLSAISCGS